jgi:TIGR02300 family protein
VAKPELGTKRICPETGRKFYDLNKDPIVSPYTGQSYPRSFFESTAESLIDEEEDLEDKELGEDGPEIVSLEEADEDTKPEDADIPDLDDDVDLGDDDDTFLEEEEEEEDDVKGIIGVSDDDEEH